MADRALRGMGLGSKSFEDEEGVEMAERQQIGFDCQNGHHFELTFSTEAELPSLWSARVAVQKRCVATVLILSGRSRSRSAPTGTCLLNAARYPNLKNYLPKGWMKSVRRINPAEVRPADAM